MKNLTKIAIALMMLTGCGYSIKQKVVRDTETYYVYFWTYVEDNRPLRQRLVTQWTDPIETANDSLKQARNLQAQQFIDKCKQLEK